MRGVIINLPFFELSFVNFLQVPRQIKSCRKASTGSEDVAVMGLLLLKVYRQFEPHHLKKQQTRRELMLD